MKFSEENRAEKFTFHIEKLSPEQALGLAPEIMSVYKEGWLATYPNEELGITADDLKTRFADIDKLTEDWRSDILESPDRATWIATGEDNKVIGFCVARKGEDNNELEYVYVLPQVQGKGIGQQLMTEALNWLGKEKPIFLVGASYNENAIKFYEKFGFKLSDETIPPKELPNGKRLPSMKMVKVFSSQ